MLQSIYWSQLCGPCAWSSTFSCCQGNQGLYIETFREREWLCKEQRRAKKTYNNLQHLMINKTWMSLIMTILPTEISFLYISYKHMRHIADVAYAYWDYCKSTIQKCVCVTVAKNKHSSSNANRTFVQCYLVFNNVLKTFALKLSLFVHCLCVLFWNVLVGRSFFTILVSECSEIIQK